MATVKFGSIRGNRCVSFKDHEVGTVPCAGWRDVGQFLTASDLRHMGKAITARESFRRWKIARKAWNTRRGNKQQLTLTL